MRELISHHFVTEDGVADPGAGSQKLGSFFGKVPAAGLYVVRGGLHQALFQGHVIFQKTIVYVQDEARRIAHGTVYVPPLRVRKEKPLFGPGHGNKCKTALFLHLRKSVYFSGGEYALVKAAEEDVGKLQALGCVDSHEADLVSWVCGVAVGKHRDVCKVILSRGLLSAGGLVLVGGLLKLRKVVQPLLRTFRAEHLLVAALVQRGGEQLRYRPVRASLREPFYQPYEALLLHFLYSVRQMLLLFAFVICLHYCRPFSSSSDNY